MRVRRSMATAAVLALVVAGCGTDEPDGLDDEDVGAEATDDDDTDDGADDGGDDGTEAEAEAASSVAVASTSLGDVLVDGDGRTLYRFDPDDAGESTCYDECETTWPPLVGPAEAGAGADASLLGTTERTDGTVQVTYAGWPLYRFAGDAAAGDVEGQGLNDVWWVVAADGEAITAGAADDEDEDLGY